MVPRAFGCALSIWLTAASLTPEVVHAQLVVAWNDATRSVGLVRLMRTLPPWQFHSRALETGTDASLHYAFGHLYATSRARGTITMIARRGWRVRRTFALGPQSEPEDIAVVSRSTAYVTRRRATHLLRLDLHTAATADVVDLSPFADSDGIPDLGTMAVHDGRLFVQIRRFNEDGPSGHAPPAYLAVVDLATEQLIDVDAVSPGTQAIELQGTGAKHRMQIVPQTRSLFVSASGGFFDAGGIEVIDLDTLRSNGMVIREADGMIGADLGPFLMITPERGFLVYSTDLDLSSHLQPFSLSAGVDPGPNLHVSVGYAVPALASDRQPTVFFLPDGVFGREGVHVFDAATGERLSSVPTATTGQPTDVLLLRTVR